MNRFCSEDYQVIIADIDKNIKIQQHQLNDLKLWHHGKNIGTCGGHFITSHQPFHFYRQAYGGVRTESGIAKATTIYLKKKNIDAKDDKFPIEFK